MDTPTEALIQKALQRLLVGRTTIVIAHHLNTIRRADLIRVVQAGCIVEQDRREDLLTQGGLYRQLYKQQLWILAPHERLIKTSHKTQPKLGDCRQSVKIIGPAMTLQKR